MPKLSSLYAIVEHHFEKPSIISGTILATAFER